MRLTDKRLLALCFELKGSNSFADIGTDHGKLPVYALLNNIVKKAIATDISAKSLHKARILSEKYALAVDIRVGDGLQPIKNHEVDTVVISGMGSSEIIAIIDKRINDFSKFILLPHKNPEKLREYLKERDIGIMRDKVVKEGKFYYHIITCSILNKWNNKHNIYIGRDNINNSDFEEYLTYRLEVLERLIKSSNHRQEFEEEKKELMKWIK